MTEIKIRLWDKKKKIMYPPFTLEGIEYTNDDDGIHFGDGYVGWDVSSDCEEMLWTGIVDKKNEDIYGGDIVKTRYGIKLVEWSNRHSSFIVRFKDFGGYGTFESEIHEDEGIEKLGTIYENPELLKNG